MNCFSFVEGSSSFGIVLFSAVVGVVVVVVVGCRGKIILALQLYAIASRT